MRFVTTLGPVAMAACMALGAGVTIAQAAPEKTTVQLSGSNEAPPTTSKGEGTAKITFNPSTRILTWTVNFSGLSTTPTMAHFHGPAAAGKNAGVQIWISKKGAAVKSPLKGRKKITAAQAKELQAGDWYVNVHTKKHPAGAIRGQVSLSK